MGVALLLGLWLAPARDAAAQAVRRRPQREVSAEGQTPAPAFGNAARGLARERRRPAAPVVRVGGAEPMPKNDSGEVEAIEGVESASVEAGTADGPNTWWGDAWPVWDRVLDAYTPRPVRKHTVNFAISHRSTDGILRDPLHGAFGIDAFNNVGLGVRVGILDRLDVGVERWGNRNLGHATYEFDVRGHVLEQKSFALDLGVRLGLSWFEQQGSPDAAGVFVQAMLGRLLFDRVYTGLNLLFHSSSSAPHKTGLDAKASMALQAAVDWRVMSGLSVALEVTPSIAGYMMRYPDITLGPRFVTNRHTFAIVLSTTSYFSADTIVVNSDKINPRDWKLGFHITREL